MEVYSLAYVGVVVLGGAVIFVVVVVVVKYHSSKVIEGLHHSPQILDHEVANEGSAAAFVLTNLTHRVLGLDGHLPSFIGIPKEATAVSV